MTTMDEIAKSFRKLAPKLARAETALGKKPVSLDIRNRENYAQWRTQAGAPGSRSREHRVMDKEGAQSQVRSIENQSRRAGRKLP